jgi:hypothetical protein
MERNLLLTSALQVHPILREDHLFKVAFMALRGDGREWAFGQIARVNGVFAPLRIPTLGEETQLVGGQDSGVSFHAFSVTPEVPQSTLDSINPFLSSADMGAALGEMNSLVRIENPLIHNPNTIDCASCHLAGRLKIRAERHRNRRSAPYIDQFLSPFKLTLAEESADNLQNLRSFGYLRSKASISQRTVNETALSLQRLLRE